MRKPAGDTDASCAFSFSIHRTTSDSVDFSAPERVFEGFPLPAAFGFTDLVMHDSPCGARGKGMRERYCYIECREGTTHHNVAQRHLPQLDRALLAILVRSDERRLQRNQPGVAAEMAAFHVLTPRSNALGRRRRCVAREYRPAGVRE